MLKRILLCLTLVLTTSPAVAQVEPTEWPLGFYGQTSGRSWQRLEVPGATCGNGTPFVVWASAGPATLAGQPNQRLAVWFEGGGHTLLTAEGQAESGLNNLGKLRGLLSVNPDYNGAATIFMDHPANDPFIGQASWLFFPYCTQDVHLGRRTEPILYDLTGEVELVAGLQAALDRGQTPQQLETSYPGLDLTVTAGASPQVTRVVVSILHRGGLNVEAGWAVAKAFFAQSGLPGPFTDLLVGGSSAGSYGAWNNAWRFGDEAYQAGGFRLTIVPSAAQPLGRLWDGQTLTPNADQAARLAYLPSFYQGPRPCAVTGGGYTALPGAVCDDVLDLIAHYRQRWPGRDVQIMPIINKEDSQLIGREYGDLPEPEFSAAVLNLCKTIHRYGQLMAQTPNVHPYIAWQYEREYSAGRFTISRAHGFDQGLMLVEMLSPNGQTEPAPYGLLETINRLAARQTLPGEGPTLIAYTAALAENKHDPAAGQRPYGTQPYLPDCNVDWPAIAPRYQLLVPAVLNSR